MLEISYLVKLPGSPTLATMNLKFSFKFVRAQSSRIYQLSAILVPPYV
jgi:hypothetical protein